MKYKDVGSKAYFEEHVGQEALIFLLNLFHFNLDSRLHIANGTFNAIYKPIQDRTGDLAALDERTRRQLLDLVTLEILSKAFMAMEDLGKILLSGGKSPKDFPNIVLDCGQDDSLQAIGRLASMDPLELAPIVPFLHPREYGLSGPQEASVQRYNISNLSAMKVKLAFIARFANRHRWAYNKYKHGIPIMLGMEGTLLPDGVDGAVPVITGKDHLELMLVGPRIVDRFLEVLVLTVQFSKTLVERKIQTVQLGGQPPLSLCHSQKDGDHEQWTPWSLVTASAEDKPVLEEVFQRTLGARNSTKVEATFKVNIEHTKLQARV
jgi:hypothetical protein